MSGRILQALYMSALVAARFNPDLKAKYQQLVASGKSPKVAITAVMRKLIVNANALKQVAHGSKLSLEHHGYRIRPANAFIALTLGMGQES